METHNILTGKERFQNILPAVPTATDSNLARTAGLLTCTCGVDWGHHIGVNVISWHHAANKSQRWKWVTVIFLEKNKPSQLSLNLTEAVRRPASISLQQLVISVRLSRIVSNYTVSTKKRPPWACLKIFKISKLCAITIWQHEYLSIFDKIANFGENLSSRHWNIDI